VTPSSRIVRLHLGDQEFRYRAGQWARIGPEGSHELTPYSIAAAPEDAQRDRHIEFLIKVDAHGRWSERYPPLARGHRVCVKGPFGTFTFPDNPVESRFLFIAGGTGIAPLRSMIRHARATHLPGSYRLLYSARTPDDFAYLPELRGMARRKELTLKLTATRAGSDKWRGQRGRIVPEHLAPLIDHPETLCFVCGPAAMVQDVPRMLMGLGIEPQRIRSEEW
jgi:NAD(P)H-flavin reductase